MNKLEFRKLIREEVRKVIKEEGEFDTNDGGQGSGSQSQTQKGSPIDVNTVKPGMNVIVSYMFDGGQGSGSQGQDTIRGVVKSVTPLQIFISVEDKKLINYVKRYQNIYRKSGLGIYKQAITTITTV
jgi:hypothetical protein